MTSPAAIVLGAGFGGLATAAALAECGLHPILIERDHITGRAEPRPGVPQSSQLHNLLGRAQLELESLAPGYLAALSNAGASFADASVDTFIMEYGQEMPRRTTGVTLVCAPRPVLESVLKERIQALYAPQVLEGATVRGLLRDDDGAVRGVATTEGDVHARIVVDAMGLNSPMLSWLEQRPPVEVISVRQWYVSATFVRPESHVGDPTFWLVFPDDQTTRGGLVSPIADDLWQVSLSGREGESPPLTAADMVSFATKLASPVIGDLIRRSQPRERPRLFRKPTARWNHVERVDGASGLLFVGDSIASLNPLLGQGISSTAWQSRLLRDVMLTHSDDLVTATALQRASTVTPITAALRLARFDEESIPLAGGGAVSATERLRQLSIEAGSDDRIHDDLVRMWHLLADPDQVLAH